MHPSFFPGAHDDEVSAPIEFTVLDIDFEPSNIPVLESWIMAVIAREKCQLEFLNFIFCSDTYLLGLNEEYLGHDTLTDIITFPYQPPPVIEGDIFISIERVQENALDYAVAFEEELHRVMIHGVLHLCGYPDKAPLEQERMREKEDEALGLLQTLL